MGYFIPLREYMPAVFAKSSSLILLEVCASMASSNHVRVLCSHRSVLSSWCTTGSGRQSPGLLNLIGTGYVLGLDGFDVIT